MPSQATAFARETEIVSRLARFFPEATPVRIPIKLSRILSHADGQNSNGNGRGSTESEQVFLQNTVVEFGTPHELLFVLERPLEFGDHVLVESTDSSLRVEASVVAVQYHPKRTVVAVRFLTNVPNWIVKS
ncbi:MAG: hypothetical protein ABSD75_03820 [Terriglobales bacterium]